MGWGSAVSNIALIINNFIFVRVHVIRIKIEQSDVWQRVRVREGESTLIQPQP